MRGTTSPVWWDSDGVPLLEVQQKVAPWWPTVQCFHAVAMLCESRYRVPVQYLCESWIAVPPLPNSCMTTPSGAMQLVCSQWYSKKKVILLCNKVLYCHPFHFTNINSSLKSQKWFYRWGWTSQCQCYNLFVLGQCVLVFVMMYWVPAFMTFTLTVNFVLQCTANGAKINCLSGCAYIYKNNNGWWWKRESN